MRRSRAFFIVLFFSTLHFLSRFLADFRIRFVRAAKEQCLETVNDTAKAAHSNLPDIQTSWNGFD